MTLRLRVLALALVALVAATLPVSARADALTLGRPCNKATDWPLFGHDLNRSFATDDNCITRGNAASLRPKWFFNTHAPITGEPIVSAGVVYVGAYDGKFYAVRAATGKAAWPHPFDATQYDTNVVDFGVFPGSAAVTSVDGRKVVVVGGGGTVFVLDAKTGALLAHQCLDRVDTTCHGKAGYTTEIESSPAIVPSANGHGVRVLVGLDVNEHSPAGPAGLISLTWDGHHLSPEWWFDPERGATYQGLAPTQAVGHQVENGCSDVWSSPTIDALTNTVAIGMRNCSHPDKVKRAAGVTLPVLTEGTVGVDLTTGALRWQMQARGAADGFGKDFDFGATPNVLSPGVIGEAGKDGTYYVMDAHNGRRLWSVHVANGSSVGGIIASTAIGELSNGHKAVFLAAAIPLREDAPQESLQDGAQHPTRLMSVHAVDLVTHKEVWSAVSAPTFGALMYTHHLVFVPNTISDTMMVLGADTGLPLRLQPMNVPPAGPASISGDDMFIGSGITENLPVVENLKTVGGLWDYTARVATK